VPKEIVETKIQSSMQSSPSYRVATGQQRPVAPHQPAEQAINPLKGILKAAKTKHPQEQANEHQAPKKKRTRSRRKKNKNSEDHTKSEHIVKPTMKQEHDDEHVIKLR